MVDDYIKQYMAALAKYETLQQLDNDLVVKYDPLHIDGEELELKLSEAVTKHFNVKKADVKKLMKMEVI